MAAEHLQESAAPPRPLRTLAGVALFLNVGIARRALADGKRDFQRWERPGHLGPLGANLPKLRPDGLPRLRPLDHLRLEQSVLVKLVALLLVPVRETLSEWFQDFVRLVLADAVGEVLTARLMLRPGVRIDRAVENAVERVVVRRRDGIKFVIVAAGAADRQPEKGLADVVERILDRDVFQIVRAHANAPRDGHVAGGNFLFPPRLLISGWKQVAGELLAHKLVIRLVVDEGIDDVVAVLEGFRHGEISGVPGSVRVAH